MDFSRKIKDFFSGVSYEEEDYYEDDYYNEYEEVESSEVIMGPRVTRSEENSKILNFNSGTVLMPGVMMMMVNCDEDVLKVIDYVRDNKICVINLQDSESGERTKQNHVDFINGALCALDGCVEKINDDTIFVTPKNIQVKGSLYNEVRNQTNSIFKIIGGQK